MKDSGWLGWLRYPVIVGFIVVLAQAYIAPKVAREVKREELILEQRLKVYEGEKCEIYERPDKKQEKSRSFWTRKQKKTEKFP